MQPKWPPDRRTLLIAVGRALAAVHVEDDDLRRLAPMNPVGPGTGEIAQGCQVLLRRQPLCLEAAHLTGRGCTTIKALAVDDGSHRWITRQSLGIVHVLVSGQASKHRLAQQARQEVARVRATPQVRPRRPAEIGEAENLVQLAVGQQTGVGGDLAPVGFQLEATIEIAPKRRWFRFTHRACNDRASSISTIY